MSTLHQSTNFKKIDDIDAITQMTIFGYVRQQSVSLNLMMNIPDLIIFIIMHYFYDIEHFTVCSVDLELDEDTNIITNTEHGVHTAYGNIDISIYNNSIYKWTFKIIRNK